MGLNPSDSISIGNATRQASYAAYTTVISDAYFQSEITGIVRLSRYGEAAYNGY